MDALAMLFVFAVFSWAAMCAIGEIDDTKENE